MNSSNNIQSVLISSPIYQIGNEFIISCYWSASTISKISLVQFWTQKPAWNLNIFRCNFLSSRQLAWSLITPFQRCTFSSTYMNKNWNYNNYRFFLSSTRLFWYSSDQNPEFCFFMTLCFIFTDIVIVDVNVFFYAKYLPILFSFSSGKGK